MAAPVTAMPTANQLIHRLTRDARALAAVWKALPLARRAELLPELIRARDDVLAQFDRLIPPPG